MASQLLERIRNSADLPSMPLVALKILELGQKPDVSVNAIADVIQNDPALAGKILKLANSPLFGLSRKVSSIHQATVTLGLRTVKVMALSFSLVKAFKPGQDGAFDYKRYWRRSLTSAAACRLIAEAVGKVRSDEGFVGGLLGDIGMMAAHLGAADLYAPVLQRLAEAPQPIQVAEQELLGTTHASLSADMLRQWSLPDLLCDAVAAHHGDGFDKIQDRTRMLASVLYAGASIAEIFCADVPVSEFEAVEARCRSLVSLAPDALRRILDELHTHVDAMASMFNIEIDQSISYEDIRAQAMMQMANLSISAEMDRAEAANRASEFERMATTDALTQIPNRKAFDARLAEALQETPAAANGLGLILLDIDHFKKLNDTHGHQAGDEALRQVGRCLSTACTAPAMAARYGGEEFGVVVAQATADALREMAEDIRRNIERIQFEHNGKPIRFTASLGVAHVNPARGTPTPQEVIERADGRLYDAKRNGRNRVEIAC